MASPKSFLDLPPELRNKTYRLLVSPDLPCASTTQFLRSEPALGSVAASTNFDIGMLSVNRRIYSEATDIFYRDHLFVRVRFSFTGTIDLIRRLGLETTVRRNTWKCPWVVMVVDVNLARGTFESELPPTDIVLACHDLPLLTCLLFHVPFVRQTDPPHALPATLQCRIENRLRLDAEHFYKSIIAPIRINRGIVNASVRLFDQKQDFVRDFDQLRAPFECLDDREYLAVHRSLVMLLESHGNWTDALYAISLELPLLWLWIEDFSFHNPGELACPDWFYKARVSLAAYEMSLTIRGGNTSADTKLHQFLACCGDLDDAQPTIRLSSLSFSIERYFRFTIPFYQEGMISPDLLRASIDLDPKDDLKMGTSEMLKAVEAGNTRSAEYNRMIDRVNQYLRLSDVDNLLARLYRLAGIVPFGSQRATTRRQDKIWNAED
ncbi:MAG: hypothetical protein Q9210_005866 [Variospora velana]